MVFSHSNEQKARCCNPFGYEGHVVRKGLRLLSCKVLKNFPELTSREYFCTKCRKKILLKLKQQEGKNSSTSGKSISVPEKLSTKLKKKKKSKKGCVPIQYNFGAYKK